MNTIGTLKVEYSGAKLVNHRGETMAWVEQFLKDMNGCVVTVREMFDEEGVLDGVLFLREQMAVE